MNTHPSIIIRRTIVTATICVALIAQAAIAHGGLEHVMGTVVSISDTSITVKTTAGKSVDVALDAKTTFAKNDQAVKLDGIKVGDRVVIHAEKSGTKLIAHTVEVGSASAAKPAAH
jgi:uncharacterized protein DUF5666